MNVVHSLDVFYDSTGNIVSGTAVHFNEQTSDFKR